MAGSVSPEFLGPQLHLVSRLHLLVAFASPLQCLGPATKPGREPMTVLGSVKPGSVKLNSVELSSTELSFVEHYSTKLNSMGLGFELSLGCSPLALALVSCGPSMRLVAGAFGFAYRLVDLGHVILAPVPKLGCFEIWATTAMVVEATGVVRWRMVHSMLGLARQLGFEIGLLETGCLRLDC